MILFKIVLIGAFMMTNPFNFSQDWMSGLWVAICLDIILTIYGLAMRD